MMLRLLLLIAVCSPLHIVAGEEKGLTREHQEQMEKHRKKVLAALVFHDVQSITAVALREEKGEPRRFVESPPKHTVRKNIVAQMLAPISEPRHYSFDGTASCFEPGFRIEIREKTRVVLLDVCLLCNKMEVTIDAAAPFIMDFSEHGLVAYKVLYVDLMVLTLVFSEPTR